MKFKYLILIIWLFVPITAFLDSVLFNGDFFSYLIRCIAESICFTAGVVLTYFYFRRK